tara:strand:- start:189 stop:299 length:111 start_codon:yes stop_codon:yes gene_type:complete
MGNFSGDIYLEANDKNIDKNISTLAIVRAKKKLHVD